MLPTPLRIGMKQVTDDGCRTVAFSEMLHKNVHTLNLAQLC